MVFLLTLAVKIWCHSDFLFPCHHHRETPSKGNHRCKTDGVQCRDSSTKIQQSTVPETSASKLSELAFDKVQVSDEEICKGLKRAFGRFVAREAVVDEEYWVCSSQSTPYFRVLAFCH